MLMEVRQYLRQQTQAIRLVELARHFDTDPLLLRQHLQTWVKRGQLEQISCAPSSCGGCTSCGNSPQPVPEEWYRWRAKP